MAQTSTRVGTLDYNLSRNMNIATYPASPNFPQWQPEKVKILNNCLFSFLGVWGGHIHPGVCVEVKGQHAGVGSFLLPWRSEDRIHVPILHGEHSHPLSHSTGPILSAFKDCWKIILMQNGYTAKCKHLFEQSSLGFPYFYRYLGLLSLCLLQVLHTQPYYQPLEANKQPEWTALGSEWSHFPPWLWPREPFT